MNISPRAATPGLVGLSFGVFRYPREAGEAFPSMHGRVTDAATAAA